jgi:glycosyltransferase involved in cell wall biosynthesis
VSGSGPLVSIVIPCYNQEAWLAEAIDSARHQTWPAVEVVVVDDGSTDRSAAIAAGCDGIRVVRQPNRGVSHARNAGLAACAGAIVIFLDADDRLRPGAAEIAAGVFASHDAAVLTFGRGEAIDASGAPVRSMTPAVGGDVYATLLRRNPIWTPGMAAWRRQAFETIGAFDPGVADPAADYDLYLRAASRFPVVAHDEVVADYRQHDASMSGRPHVMLASTLAVLQRQRRVASRRPAWEQAWRAGRREWRVFYGEQMVDRFRAAIRRPGGRGEAVRWALRLLRACPQIAVREMGRKARATVHGG